MAWGANIVPQMLVVRQFKCGDIFERYLVDNERCPFRHSVLQLMEVDKKLGFVERNKSLTRLAQGKMIKDGPACH